MYLGSPLCFAALQIWPMMRRISSYIGLVILIISLVASSFSTTVWQLILTQGCLYGIGGILLYSPVIVFVDEWFIRRKGLAYGVMWVSAFPKHTLLFDHLLNLDLGRHRFLGSNCPLSNVMGSEPLLLPNHVTHLGRCFGCLDRSSSIFREA